MCSCFRNIQSTSQKIRRAILQFTPESWTPIHWLDPNCTYGRYLAVTQLIIGWQLTELNTFFLKHIFEAPPAHPLNTGRIALLGVIVAPSVRQYYTYVSDTRCKRVGTQCWVFVAIMLTESLICIKFGLALFAQAQIWNIIYWLLIQVIHCPYLFSFEIFILFTACTQRSLCFCLCSLGQIEMGTQGQHCRRIFHVVQQIDF